MGRIRVLDCTLRDGGYINDWDFGKEGIDIILDSLDKSRIDIVEIGFLSNRIQKNTNLSKFTSVQDISDLIGEKPRHNIKVCMINYGEYELDDIPNATDVNLDGIRIAFHKKDVNEAIPYCDSLIKKGYKVFIQPMVAANYTDEEYLDLINKSNQINPYAFYVVDSFGVMKQNDVIRYFYMADYNLKKNIYIGFHSHNNLQLSYSNSQALISTNSTRELIVDSSIHGMGRGAGNLNTELFLDYLNTLNLGDYKVEPLLEAIDYVIKPIHVKRPWGYSLPHYLSAINNCHPNYATYLDDLSTLTVKDISILLSRMDSNKKNNFDKSYIKELYVKYQEENKDLTDDVEKLKAIFEGKEILLIAPGKSINSESEKVVDFIKKTKPIVIGVNFQPEDIPVDFLFFSNKRRYDQAVINSEERVICTSNIINNSSDHFVVNYDKLLNNIGAVEDNAGLMLLSLLYKLNILKIHLAGFDGYSLDKSLEESFAKKEFSTAQTMDRLERINLGMNYMINEFSKKMKINFLTAPVNIKIFNDKYYD